MIRAALIGGIADRAAHCCSSSRSDHSADRAIAAPANAVADHAADYRAKHGTSNGLAIAMMAATFGEPVGARLLIGGLIVTRLAHRRLLRRTAPLRPHIRPSGPIGPALRIDCSRHWRGHWHGMGHSLRQSGRGQRQRKRAQQRQAKVSRRHGNPLNEIGP